MSWSVPAICSWLFHLLTIQGGPSSWGVEMDNTAKRKAQIKSARWRSSSHFIKEDFETYQICFPKIKGPSNSILISSVSKEKSFIYLFFKKGSSGFPPLEIALLTPVATIPSGRYHPIQPRTGFDYCQVNNLLPAHPQSQMKSPCYWIERPSQKKTYKTSHQNVHLDAIES